jgi:hypothetical protein
LLVVRALLFLQATSCFCGWLQTPTSFAPWCIDNSSPECTQQRCGCMRRSSTCVGRSFVCCNSHSLHAGMPQQLLFACRQCSSFCRVVAHSLQHTYAS